MNNKSILKIAFPSKGRLRKDLEKLLSNKKINFIENQKIDGNMYNIDKFKGGNQPPKKSIKVNTHIKIILIFSPKKN